MLEGNFLEGSMKILAKCSFASILIILHLPQNKLSNIGDRGCHSANTIDFNDSSCFCSIVIYTSRLSSLQFVIVYKHDHQVLLNFYRIKAGIIVTDMYI